MLLYMSCVRSINMYSHGYIYDKKSRVILGFMTTICSLIICFHIPKTLIIYLILDHCGICENIVFTHIKVSFINCNREFMDWYCRVVEGKDRFGNTYTPLKVCVECVTSLVTKMTRDDVTMMTSWWNTCVMLRWSKIYDVIS